MQRQRFGLGQCRCKRVGSKRGNAKATGHVLTFSGISAWQTPSDLAGSVCALGRENHAASRTPSSRTLRAKWLLKHRLVWCTVKLVSFLMSGPCPLHVFNIVVKKRESAWLTIRACALLHHWTWNNRLFLPLALRSPSLPSFATLQMF
jgi:hypothetical protein